MNKQKWFGGALNPLRTEGKESWENPALTQHYTRYSIALQHTVNCKVLDAASGVCYGSSLLSMRAKEVTAVNNSQEQLDYGKEMFRFYCPINFMCIDLNNEFPDEMYDVIVTFETVEHLEDSDFFLSSCKERLNKDGVFICSVPKTPLTIYHKKEIKNFEEAKKIFDPHFPRMEWRGQNVSVSSDLIGAMYWIGIWQK